MKNIFIILFLFLIASCAKEENPNRIFFGGQIVNPSSSFVTLYKDNKTIDSLKLNDNYRFFKYYDSLESGIYKIEHIPEYQSVFLEKGDSIWARINASAFDESIVYSGKGAAKNNFMMDLHLNYEDEISFLSSKYSNDGQTFNSIIDSLMFEKKKKWILMDTINKLTPYAQKITQAAYIYPYAAKRERYALLRGTNWTKAQDTAFFSYRKYLSLGETDLAFFDPYITYLLNYLNNQALDSAQYYFQNKEKVEFNIKRLQLIEKNISGSVLKNNLARAVAFEELLNFKNHDMHETFLRQFLLINTSNAYLNEVLSLHDDINNMGKGRKLPELFLQSHTLERISSNELFKKKTVLYFWSQTQMTHYRSTSIKVKELEAEYPNYAFIGICIQPFNEIVNQVHKMMGIDPNSQFAFTDFDAASKKWVLTLLNKGIIIDENGKIIEGFGNFSSPSFIKLLNKK